MILDNDTDVIVNVRDVSLHEIVPERTRVFATPDEAERVASLVRVLRRVAIQYLTEDACSGWEIINEPMDTVLILNLR